MLQPLRQHRLIDCHQSPVLVSAAGFEPRIGKTTLAVAALHEIEVDSKYSRKNFVPCQSSPSCAELISAVADHIHLEKALNMHKKVAQYFMHAPPSLLVLDNLETPWEASSSRGEVEEFLCLLADIPHLGLLVLSDPQKSSGAAPFWPLSDSAALRTFIDVADDIHREDSIREILELTGNLPLAVSLIAIVASYEGCGQALSRWNSESTYMLSNGHDQRSSLDISIMLSFTSFRMTPEARELLSILSMLPDGLKQGDLVKAQLPISNILACKTTLVQTSLAFIDKDERLKVLAPIREHILRLHPPSSALKLKLRQHFHQLLELWDRFHNFPTDMVPEIVHNLGNLNSVLREALSTDSPDITCSLRSILSLSSFYRRTQSTYAPLLLDLSQIITHWQDQSIFGDYLVERFQASRHLPVTDVDTNIEMGNIFFHEKSPLEQAKWYHALGCYFYLGKRNVNSALEYYQRALSLSDSTGSPQMVVLITLCQVSVIMLDTGNPSAAQQHTNKALEYALNLGDIYGQAQSLRCQAIFATYQQAQILLKNARDVIHSCGLQGGTLDMEIRNYEAEIYLVRTEYLKSREIQVSIVSNLRPTTYQVIGANLNIAMIDTAIGVDSKLVHRHLEDLQSHIKQLPPYMEVIIGRIVDQRFADIHLQEGNHTLANVILAQTFSSSLGTDMEEALMCLERLADLSTEMNNIKTTLGWAAIFLGLALKSKDKLATAKSLCCIGQIFLARGEDETALSLFNVALEEFTFMDVHRWRADCMVRIADILECQGEAPKAFELWHQA
ncbi:hypothetical protein C8J57DRAFT_1231329 [Mycena rebaudengoi]|nr:hypothetical protein C8J57DRAFT_1231329 [Mycena rebaudengoi]